jgi:hypothetical protein
MQYTGPPASLARDTGLRTRLNRGASVDLQGLEPSASRVSRELAHLDLSGEREVSETGSAARDAPGYRVIRSTVPVGWGGV